MNMITIEMTDKEAVMVAGIIGATEGLQLNDFFYKLIAEIRKHNGKEYILISEIADLIREELNCQEDPIINEDYLYDEARKLNGLLD